MIVLSFSEKSIYIFRNCRMKIDKPISGRDIFLSAPTYPVLSCNSIYWCIRRGIIQKTPKGSHIYSKNHPTP